MLALKVQHVQRIERRSKHSNTPITNLHFPAKRRPHKAAWSTLKQLVKKRTETRRTWLPSPREPPYKYVKNTAWDSRGTQAQTPLLFFAYVCFQHRIVGLSKWGNVDDEIHIKFSVHKALVVPSISHNEATSADLGPSLPPSFSPTTPYCARFFLGLSCQSNYSLEQSSESICSRCSI